MGSCAFRPTCVNPAFRWGLKWLKAAEEAGLPGSSFKALSAILGHVAEGRGAISRHGLSRRSGMARTTLRNGVDLLLRDGWLLDTPQGLVIPLAKPAVPLVKTGGGRKSPPRKEPKEKIKSMAPHAPTPPAPGGMSPAVEVPRAEKPTPEPLTPDQEAIVSALELAGCHRAGARSAAKVESVNLAKVQELIQDLEDLQRAGQVRNMPAIAVWAIKQGPSAVRGFKRQAGRLRGRQVRKIPTTATPAQVRPSDPVRTMATWRLLRDTCPGADDSGFECHMILQSAVLADLHALGIRP